MIDNQQPIFQFDLRRTAILSKYIEAWGAPLYRKVANKGAQRIEVYCFTPPDSIITRYATVGVSDFEYPDAMPANWEFLLVTPGDDSDKMIDEVFGYIFDIMAYSRVNNVKLKVGLALDESPIAPISWKARGILIDEPRGEPEFLEKIHYRNQCISLFWLVPIHKAEYDSIVRSGLGEFDAADQASEWSLADPWRDSLI